MVNATENKSPQPIQNHNSWIYSLITLFFVYWVFTQGLVTQPQQLSYDAFLEAVENNQVSAVTITGLQLTGRYAQSSVDSQSTRRADFKTVIPAIEDRHLLDTLAQHNVKIRVQADKAPVWPQLIMGFVPWLLIFALFFYSSRLMQKRMSAGGGLFDFGKSRARRYESSQSGPSYKDVAGLENAKRDLKEIVDFLKHPESFKRIGAKMPKGVLMMGPPGTGKTLLAKATANEAGVPFFSISGSEFIEMYVGVGASRVRDMFKQAREAAPSLIFIDEIDSVGRTRGTGLGGGHDEREQTLNQILAEMDGFDPEEAVIVLAATNRPDVLDPALLRPGRFDRKVILDLPQRQARYEILQVHTKKTPLTDDIDLKAIAAITVGFSGADLANLVNEAALHAAREKREKLVKDDFDWARDKIVMGDRRENMLTDSDKQRIACHEAGHALTAFLSTHSDPVEKVSIVPRGRALGITEQRPENDRYTVDEDYVMEKLRILLAGRNAEKLLFGNCSSGAADDLKQATKLARKMVSQWGMSNDIGPLGLESGEEHPFLGRELALPKDYSEHLGKCIDEEVIRLLKQAETETHELLSNNLNALKRLQSALLANESLQHNEIEELIQQR